MTLRLERIEEGPQEVTWSIDLPTTGVVLIDAEVARVVVPLHWRAGTWTKPPLDVQLDAGGGLASLQFVMQDERVDTAAAPALPEGRAGRPVFDVDGWPENRYLDEKLPVTAGRLDDGSLLLRIGDAVAPESSCRVAGELALGFDAGGGLSEIRLGPLTGEDWKKIESSGG